jgi:hypothetical protein
LPPQEKQRRQRAIARLTRVRSALTQKVKRFVRRKVRGHAGLPAQASGQLLFLGLKPQLPHGLGQGLNAVQKNSISAVKQRACAACRFGRHLNAHDEPPR